MKTFLRRLFLFFLAVTVAINFSVMSAEESSSLVTIEDMGTYYNVVLNYQDSVSHRAMGEELGRKILEAIPNYEMVLDSALFEMSYQLSHDTGMTIDQAYQFFLGRVNDIKDQLPQEYLDELVGMASQFSGQETDVPADGKLSINEVLMLNLMPDIIRGTNCSFLAVYGDRSETGNAMFAKVFDWNPGSQNQLSEIQGVIHYNQGEKSIIVVGLVGWMIGSNGINNDHVFIGALDSSTHGAYSSAGKRSYSFDARYALENFDTLDGALGYLQQQAGNYVYSHNYAGIDRVTAKVLENNVNNPELAAIRTEGSELASGIIWDIDNSIAAVNSFALAGNYTNGHGWAGNSNRWDSFRTQLAAKGDKVSFEDLRAIGSYYTGAYPREMPDGDIYNVGTQQVIILEPSSLRMEVFFKPKGLDPQPLNPVFDVIDISFAGTTPEDPADPTDPADPVDPVDPQDPTPSEPELPQTSDPLNWLPIGVAAILAGAVLLLWTRRTRTE